MTGKIVITVDERDQNACCTEIEADLQDVDKLSKLILVCNLCNSLRLNEIDMLMIPFVMGSVKKSKYSSVIIDTGLIEKGIE